MRLAGGRRRIGTLWRLMIVHALVLGAALSVLGYAAVESVTGRAIATLTHDLVEEVPEYSAAAATRPPTQSLSSFSRSYLQTHLLPEGHVLVVGLNGQPVLGSTGSRPVALSKEVERYFRHPPTRTAIATVRTASASYRVVASPVVDGTRREGVLVAAASLDDVWAQRSRMIVVAIGEGALVLYIALLSAFLILRRLLGSVAALTAAAEEIREGDLERRIDYKGPQDEVGRLASTFDGMIGQISSAFEAQRQLLADVSHQLRTPLTVIRGHLEVLRRTPCDNPAEVRDTLNLALDALAHTSSLVERLLLLGRSLEADFLATERVDLRSFLGDIVEASRVLAERNFELGSVPDIVILVDRDKLEGALLNLVDNAVKATVPGDSIRIAAAVQKSTADHSGGNTHAGDGRGARLARGKVGDQATEIVISVTDSGHGIQPEARQLVFERFQRSEHPGQPPGGGAGLGLAIVRAVAEAHGGRVELDSLPGEGCTVRIVLPESCREEQAALAAETP